MNLSVIIFIILFIFTAILASLEMALSSVNKLRIKAQTQEDKRFEVALKLIDNYDETLTTIIVLNNIINIILPTISTIIFLDIFSKNPELGILISTVFLTLLLLTFGEILPKLYGKKNPEKMLKLFSNFLVVVVKLFKPLTFLFIKTNNFVRNKFFTDIGDTVEVETEILTMIEEGKEEGKIEQKESELLRNAIEFNDIRVDEILQPKNKMVMIDIDSSNEEIYNIIINEKYSRMPVFENTTDNIVGVISERDFLKEYITDAKFKIKKIIRNVDFVPDTLKISKLLPNMQKQHNNMSIVVDEHGTVQGLITVEDIVEELVGEIWDEHDEVIAEYIKISKDCYQVRGDIVISDFNDLFTEEDIDTETEDSTIAGYLLEKAEKIPDVKEVIEDENFTFKVLELNGQKIEKVEVKIKRKNSDE